MKKIQLFLPYAVLLSILIASCQGNQGDPGPTGNSNVITKFLTVSSFIPAASIGEGMLIYDGNVSGMIDTNAAMSIYLVEKSNGYTSEYPLPYTDINGTKYSYSFYYTTFIKQGQPWINESIGININLATETILGNAIFKYVTIPK